FSLLLVHSCWFALAGDSCSDCGGQTAGFRLRIWDDDCLLEASIPRQRPTQCRGRFLSRPVKGIESTTQRPLWLEAVFDLQDDLAELFALIHSPVGGGGFSQREDPVNRRMQFCFVVEFEERRELARAAHQQPEQRQLLEEAAMEVDLRQPAGGAV